MPYQIPIPQWGGVQLGTHTKRQHDLETHQTKGRSKSFNYKCKLLKIHKNCHKSNMLLNPNISIKKNIVFYGE